MPHTSGPAVNLPLLLERARLCSSLYADDANAEQTAFSDLGYTVILRYRNDDHLAVILLKDGEYTLVICGTRFSEWLQGNANITDIWDDLDDTPLIVDPSSGAAVMSGFDRGMKDLWDWAKSFIPVDHAINVVGHSLGGARTHLTPLYLDPERIASLTSFGAPKAANGAYWSRYNKLLDEKMIRVVAGRDLWVGYPWLERLSNWSPMLWLHDGVATETTESTWPGGVKLADHAIDTSYVAALEALISPSAVAA